MGTQIPRVLGYPPGSKYSNPAIVASMPIAKIQPQIPSFSKGLTIFKLKNAWSDGTTTHPSYTAMLDTLGYSCPGNCITVAFLADNFPTDTFTNEYGESFLEKLTSMSSGIGEMSQMFGAGSLGEVADGVSGFLTDASKEEGLVGTAAGVMSGAMKNVIGAKDRFKAYANEQGGFTKTMLNTVSQMMAGARVDFPQVWKNSGFQPSYSMTVRLYNPDPNDLATTEKYIIGPIAALALLAVPISEDGNLYNWPYLHKIKSPGIYDLNPAFISNVTIVKGGDQQQIGWNQRMGIVDVRLDFGSLYSSMIAVKGGGMSERPTLKTYVDALKVRKPVFASQIHKPNPGKRVEVPDRVIVSKTINRTSVTQGRGSRNNTSRIDTAKQDITNSLVSNMNV
jgi:hypothetical protein